MVWQAARMYDFPPDETFYLQKEKGMKSLLDRISLLLVIVGAVNWLLVGLFQFDVVAWIFGGQAAIVSRIIYAVVGIAGLWCITLLFKDRNREVVTRGD